jgi:hypothetical protein
LVESTRVLSALVMYLRTWVDSWAATQPRATKKTKPKHMIRKSTEPMRVSQGGRAR